MTDNEIIKALEEIKESETLKQCSSIPNVAKDSLDLIKRQQAEIERLKKTNPLFEYAAKSVHQYIEDGKTYYLDFVNEEYEAEAISKKIDYLCNIQDIRAEAIKEFTDRLKQNLSFGKYITAEQIDNLAKEMVGADNE